MKAIVQERFGPPDVLQLVDTDPPEAGADDVLVRVRAAALNPYDWHMMRGDPLIARLMGGVGVTRPKARVAGVDAAGRVEAVGANVRGLRHGEEVLGFCHGAFAEYARAEADKVAPKPGEPDLRAGGGGPHGGADRPAGDPGRPRACAAWSRGTRAARSSSPWHEAGGGVRPAGAPGSPGRPRTFAAAWTPSRHPTQRTRPTADARAGVNGGCARRATSSSRSANPGAADRRSADARG